MVSLIDADSLIYKSGFSFEEKFSWNALELELGIEAEPQTSYSSDLVLSKNAIDATIENIKLRTDCDEIELWLSGKNNFRYEVMETYKGNRVNSRKPLEYSNLFNYLVKEYNANIADTVEADDVVVFKKTTEPLRYCLCAIDKDVLYQTVGTHYNYNKDEFITVSEEEANRFFWYQVLTGDGVDGYKGCKGIGKVKAKEILDKAYNDAMESSSDTEEFYRRYVKEAYEYSGQSEEEFLATCRVANMHQIKELKPTILLQLFE